VLRTLYREKSWGRGGREDNLTCSSAGNTVAPHSDKRILKDRKKQMSRRTVLMSEKEDPHYVAG